MRLLGETGLDGQTDSWMLARIGPCPCRSAHKTLMHETKRLCMSGGSSGKYTTRHHMLHDLVPISLEAHKINFINN
jgi:hypothetical protein